MPCVTCLAECSANFLLIHLIHLNLFGRVWDAEVLPVN